MTILQWLGVNIGLPWLLWTAFLVGQAIRRFSTNQYRRVVESCVVGAATAIVINTEPRSVWLWLIGIVAFRFIAGFIACNQAMKMESEEAAQAHMLQMGAHTGFIEIVTCIVSLFFYGPLAAVAIWVIAFYLRDPIYAIHVRWAASKYRDA